VTGALAIKWISSLGKSPSPSPSPPAAAAALTGTTVLHYFQGRGRAEGIRWMLAAAAIPFQDPPYTTAEQWVKIKASGVLPFDQFPLLEIGGQVLTQSRACVSHIARISNLYGDSHTEATAIDVIGHAISDFEPGIVGFPFKEDKTAARVAAQELVDKWCPKFAKITRDNGASKFMVGSRVSYADVRLAEVLTGYTELLPGCLAPYPELAAIRAHVANMPAVAAYLASEQRWKFPTDDDFKRYTKSVWEVLGRPIQPWVNK